jgi:hypothetical protein
VSQGARPRSFSRPRSYCAMKLVARNCGRGCQNALSEDDSRFRYWHFSGGAIPSINVCFRGQSG